MSASNAVAATDDIDDSVDREIIDCLCLEAPRSFFLFAGAGSGKTRSLVNSLQHVKKHLGETLRLKGQRVGVITYTNVAAEEIKRRIAFDPIIHVSTIHSFAWSLISGLNHDIKEWLRINLTDDIAGLERDEAKGRKGTKASATRISQIASKRKRLENLDTVKRFIYSPTGENRGRDALNHSEVIKLSSHFLRSKPVMQSILVGRYPFLLIDESQDTNKDLVDALFTVQSAQKNAFSLGLLGDMMQRIYADGKEGLGLNLPADWAKPVKQMNHRCPKRVVTLINKIREATDKQQQRWRSDSIDGYVRLFILPSDTVDKPGVERAIAQHMANISGDDEWNQPHTCKTLTLEHRMAARRMGFLEIFVPLYEVESWRTSLLDGTIPIVRFFSELVLPLVKAAQSNDRFAVARIAKQSCPMLTSAALRAAEDQQAQLKLVSASIETLLKLWKDGADPALSEVLHCVGENRLFSIPEILQPNAYRDQGVGISTLSAEADEVDPPTQRAKAIDNFLTAPFSQIEPFATYFSGDAHFDTHQGVKGLEFDRVMVIMDDEEARGFMFNYENLFGGKRTNDPAVDSTRRLFYVTCSRARHSLALVAYSMSPERVRQHVLKENWFKSDEIIEDVAVQSP